MTPLEALDLSQTHAAAVIAQLDGEHMDRPTPCDDWSVRDVLNKMVASTITFTAFAERTRPDPPLDLVDPPELIGDQPLAVFLDAAFACRAAWRAEGALDGMAPSTVGEFPAKAVLHARVFDTTVLTIDIAAACGLDAGIGEPLASYVLRIAKALVPNVRAKSPERYKDMVQLEDEASTLHQLLATTGRDPAWVP